VNPDQNQNVMDTQHCSFGKFYVLFGILEAFRCIGEGQHEKGKVMLTT
jgi:hypothetical protein